MDEQLLPATDAASAAVGVDFRVYRPAMIRRRIEHRMRLRGCSDLDEYTAVLARDPAERWRLADAFLIKTTSAFRDRATWDALRKTLLPRLIARCVRRGSATLCAWVAGCSTGEEAYSYAMAILDSRDKAGVSIGVRVFATDVDVAALEHAARGVYAPSAFASTPPELRARYLQQDREEKLVVTDALREVVSFSRHSLTSNGATPIETTVFASFDLVSCCNVLLYFDDATRRDAFARLLSCCERGGLVVLGEAEYPPPEFQRALASAGAGMHAFELIR